MNKQTKIIFGILLVLGLLVPFQNVVYVVLVMQVMCFALFACAFNLLLGYTGLLSFGHAAFFGGASYVTAYCCKELGLTPEVGILLGMALAGTLGWIMGSLAIRRQGIYFAMITLALAQMVLFMAEQMDFTGGENGIQGVPRGKLFGLIDLSSDTALYYFVFAIFVLGFALILRTVHSPFGQILKSIRENEPRAISLGYDVDKFKLLAFVLSATLAGMAGSTKALVFQLASLTDVNSHTSAMVILMSLIGGLGTIFGPVVGATVVVGLEYVLTGMNLDSWNKVVSGAIFVICVLAFRRGIIGEITALFKRGQKTSPDTH